MDPYFLSGNLVSNYTENNNSPQPKLIFTYVLSSERGLNIQPWSVNKEFEIWLKSENV